LRRVEAARRNDDARKEPQTATLQELQTRFEEWRGKRQGRFPIPSELWSAAMEVARHNGVGRTAAALHLDALAREQNLSPDDRLLFHQKHSGPLMEKLREWLKAQFVEHRTEPNSGLGKAISYLLNHWTKLTLFLSQPGAPIDNNVVERALKKGHSESQKRALLQDAEWSAHR
jgi:hypothetical protein